jgi:hypothetical protein
MTAAALVPLASIAVIIALLAAVTWAGRRGHPVGAHVIVRCRAGHLFTTAWIPGVSFKAVRLGWYRLQWCPVGKHWTLVAPVPAAGLSDEERREAARYRDGSVP